MYGSPAVFLMAISNALSPFVSNIPSYTGVYRNQSTCRRLDITANGIGASVEQDGTGLFIYNFTDVNHPRAVAYVNVSNFVSK